MWIKWGIFVALIITTLLSIFGEWCLIKLFDRAEEKEEKARLQSNGAQSAPAPWDAGTDKPKVDSKPTEQVAKAVNPN